MPLLQKSIIVLILISITLGVGGWEMKKETTVKYTNDEKKEMVLEYLREKYNEEFVGLSYWPSESPSQWDAFYVHSKNGTKDDLFEVLGNPRSKDGSYELKDGYFGIYIRDEYEKVMRSFIDEFYSEYKIYLQTDTEGMVPQRLNKDTKLNEIYQEGEKYGFCTNVYVYVKESSVKNVNIKEATTKIAMKRVEQKLVGETGIFIIRDDRYDEIKMDKENWQQASGEENVVEEIVLDVNFSLQIKNYREGY